MQSDDEYIILREKAKDKYKLLNSATCPALKEEVYFTSVGFNHLIYKKGNTERDRSSQAMRFKLLERSHELISLTTTYQEYEESENNFTIKKKKSKVKTIKIVKYWGIIAILKDRKIKVILRKVGNGNLHFWSVIPAWITNKSRDSKLIKTMKGDPDMD